MPKPGRNLLLAVALCACAGPAASPSTPTPTAAPTFSPTPSPTVSPNAALPAGWTTTTRASDGFSIALPPSWRTIELDSQAFAAVYKALADQNPDFAAALSPDQAAGLLAEGVKVMAFDFSRAQEGFGTNMNVIHEELPVETSLDVLTQINTAQLQGQLKIDSPEVTHTTLGSLQATRFHYSVPLERPQGSLPISITQYYVVRGKDAYVMTFTTASAAERSYGDLFEQIAKTFALAN
jgi:hypothetical protein